MRSEGGRWVLKPNTITWMLLLGRHHPAPARAPRKQGVSMSTHRCVCTHDRAFLETQQHEGSRCVSLSQGSSHSGRTQEQRPDLRVEAEKCEGGEGSMLPGDEEPSDPQLPALCQHPVVHVWRGRTRVCVSQGLMLVEMLHSAIHTHSCVRGAVWKCPRQRCCVIPMCCPLQCRTPAPLCPHSFDVVMHNL